MCYRLFIASDGELPLVAPTDPPTFHVEPVSPELVTELPFTPGSQVVEAGSSTGCACDFHADDVASRQRLVAYLRPFVGRQRLHIYSTWYADETDPYAVQAALPIDGLLADLDPIPQQTLTAII